MLDALSYGGFGGRQLALFVVATKTPGATGDRIPQQSLFARTPPKVAAGGAPGVRVADDPLLLTLKRWKKRLERLAPRRLPPVLKRY